MRLAFKTIGKMTDEEYAAVMRFHDDPRTAAQAMFRLDALSEAEIFALWYLAYVHDPEEGFGWPEWEALWGRGGGVDAERSCLKPLQGGCRTCRRGSCRRG